MNETQELVGLATIRDLNTALEGWYEQADKTFWTDGTLLHDQLQKAMVEVTTHGSTSDAMEIFASVVRKMKRSTGLTLGEVCERGFDTILGEDKVVRARNIMNVRGASVLPVMKDEESNIALGVIDLASIRMAAKLQETMEIMSKSMLSTRPK